MEQVGSTLVCIIGSNALENNQTTIKEAETWTSYLAHVQESLSQHVLP